MLSKILKILFDKQPAVMYGNRIRSVNKTQKVNFSSKGRESKGKYLVFIWTLTHESGDFEITRKLNNSTAIR